MKRIDRTQQRIDELRLTVDRLQIVDRKITGDMHALFVLRGPSDSLIGTTCVTALPCHHVAVIGDLTTIVFATYGSNHWRSAIGRFWRGDGEGISIQYVLEKAALGMDGFRVSEFNPDEALYDLRELFVHYRRDALECGDEPCYNWSDRAELLRTARYNGETALYDLLSDHDEDFNDRWIPFGHLPKQNVLAGALAMNHLCKLLAQEETEVTCTPRP